MDFEELYQKYGWMGQPTEIETRDEMQAYRDYAYARHSGKNVEEAQDVVAEMVAQFGKPSEAPQRTVDTDRVEELHRTQMGSDYYS